MNFFLTIIAFFSISFYNSTKENELIKNQHKKEILIGYKNFKLITSLNKIIKTRSEYDNELIEDCKNWILSESSLSNLLKKMRKVEGHQWYSMCYDYPCYYEGKVSNGKTEYEITISSASYIQLNNENETLIFVLEEESDLFLAACDCCE